MILLFHPRQPRVANKVPLQVGVDRTLAAQPREGAFCFMAQIDFFKFAGFSVTDRFDLTFDRDLHKVSTRSGSNIKTSRRNKRGLVARVSPENSKDGGHIRIVDGLLIALEQARDMAAAQAGFTRKVRLLEPMPFRQPVQRGAEIAHKFFCPVCPILWEVRFNAITLAS